MFRKFKGMLQVLFGVALVAQLAGCIFVDRDRHGHPWHHGRDSGPNLNVNIH